MKCKKIIIAIIVILVTIANISVALAAPVNPRDWDTITSGGKLRSSAVSSETAILMDAHTGKVLYSKQMDRIMFPASITKIMTALVVIENANLYDIVSIGNDISEAISDLKGSGAAMSGFQNGETVSVEELVYGLMLTSGADAAVALAIHTAGSYDAFIELMNQTATKIGMEDSDFKNPHGLYDSGHETTAYDMALLTRYAQKYPSFVKIVGTAAYTPTDTDKNNYSDSGTIWRNSNKLITDDKSFGYDYATGVKTGFIRVAGHTLVTSAEKGEVSLIGVVLKDTANGKWTSSITMFEYGFEFYDTIDLSKFIGGKEILVSVENAASSTGSNDLRMQLVPVKRTYITLVKDEIEQMRENPEVFKEKITYFNTPLRAPIQKAEIVGKVEYTYQDEVVFTAELMAANKVEAIPGITPVPSETEVPENATATPKEDSPNTLLNIIVYVLIVLAAVLILIIVLMIANRRSRHQQYSHRKTARKSLLSNKKIDIEDDNIPKRKNH